MHGSTRIAVVLASITACGARAEGGDASAGSSSGAASQSDASTSDAESSSGAASIGSADGSAGTGGDTPLAIDPPPVCVSAPASVLDYVVAGSGDGSPLTCSRAMGSGEGVLPAGVSFDEDACAVVGEPAADRYGTWAIIVKVTQGDLDLWVPYCITQDQQADGDALVEVVTADRDDAALLPLLGTFTPDAPLAAGSTVDPRFRVIDTSRCGESCSYSYQFFLSPSPFDVESDPVIVDTMIVTEDGDPVGMSHGIALAGPPIGEGAPQLADRPWVFGLDLDYCLSNDADDCDTSTPRGPNVAARFRYSVVMSPE